MCKTCNVCVSAPVLTSANTVSLSQTSKPWRKLEVESFLLEIVGELLLEITTEC